MARHFDNIPHERMTASEQAVRVDGGALFYLNPPLADEAGVHHFYVVVQFGRVYQTLHASNALGEFDDQDSFDLARDCVLTARGYEVLE